MEEHGKAMSKEHGKAMSKEHGKAMSKEHGKAMKKGHGENELSERIHPITERYGKPYFVAIFMPTIKAKF
jgi:hypothetical protein